MFKKIISAAFIVIPFLFLGCQSSNEDENQKGNLPNIVIIYADDLGYGDVSAYDAGTLNTPNIDKLANGGIKFTSGYASSATCSPSRYALLTGTYPWRNKDAKILPGTAPLLIDTAQMTIPKCSNPGDIRLES
jgi:arylsulfatase A-like enzyme